MTLPTRSRHRGGKKYIKHYKNVKHTKLVPTKEDMDKLKKWLKKNGRDNRHQSWNR